MAKLEMRAEKRALVTAQAVMERAATSRPVKRMLRLRPSRDTSRPVERFSTALLKRSVPEPVPEAPLKPEP
jgi:hypothetical protein